MKEDTNYNSHGKISQSENSKKIKSFMGNKKQNICIIVFVLLLLVLSLPFIIHSYMENKKSDLESVTEYIEKLGKKFYEDYYYLQLSELKENNMIEDSSNFLENFVINGIPVTLNQVIELHFKTEKELNKFLKKYQCDFETTGFTIYPEAPYEKKSYRLEPHVSCSNLNLEKEDNE